MIFFSLIEEFDHGKLDLIFALPTAKVLCISPLLDRYVQVGISLY